MRHLPFLITQKLKWEGLPFHEDGGALPPTDRGRELFARYRLARWSDRWSELTLDEVLGVLDILDRLPRGIFPKFAELNLKALDVGSKNWRYLGALVAWLEERFPKAELDITGVELDAYRLGPNLRTWLATGNYFAGKHSDAKVKANYLAGNICLHEVPASLVFWLFPFVSEHPHQAWGLPPGLFDPRAAFKHVLTRCLSREGVLILANHGEWEAETARKLIAEIPGTRLVYQVETEGSLHASRYPVVVSVIGWVK